MPIPDFQSLMLPLLEMAADGNEHSVAEAREFLAGRFELTDDERRKMLASGQQTVFSNRVAWAKVYLERADILEKTRRGYFRIAPEGRNVLKNPPERITVTFLNKYPGVQKFRGGSDDGGGDDTGGKPQVPPDRTPEEILAAAYCQIEKDLAVQLLEQVKAGSPEFFERLVLDLMLKMGYGGSREQAGQVTPRGADGGIDGIINEDQLGLDLIYLQAKRWENTVGRPEIQKFVGALHGHRARKGVFLTTSSFSQEANDYAAMIDPKVVLIDGSRLTELMIRFGVGVSTVRQYEIKRIDSDYFIEE